MSDYTINGKSLSDFGIKTTRKIGSSLALTGAWDLPKRKGNTSYDWKESDDVEAFVDAGDMLYEGRTLTLTGIMISEGKQTIEQYIALLQTYLDTVNNNAFVLSSEWGTWNVQMSGDIKITRMNAKAAVIEMTFFEPTPDLSGSLPVPVGTGEDIDGYAWEEFGLYVSAVSGAQNIPSRKTIDITMPEGDNSSAYGGRSARKITISGIIITESYPVLVSKIHALYALFTSPGLRTYKYRGNIYKCFAPEGFTVSNLNVSTKAMAVWSITLTTASNE